MENFPSDESEEQEDENVFAVKKLSERRGDKSTGTSRVCTRAAATAHKKLWFEH